MVTDQNGNLIARHDYMPFGEEIPSGNAGRGNGWGASDNVNQKFTGQLRDSETGLDYFNARYFGSSLNRFMSPDPGNAGGDPTDPQTWNAYAYVANNPLNATDPSGMDSTGINDPVSCISDASQADCGYIPVGGTGIDVPVFGGGGGSGVGGGGGAPTPPATLPGSTPPPPGSFPGSSNVPYSCNLFDGCWIPVYNAYLPAPGLTFSVTKTESLSSQTGSPTVPNSGLPKQTTNLFTIPGTNYCGPGGAGGPTNRVDIACAAHDRCYDDAHVSWRNNVGLAITTPQQRVAMQACDAGLSNFLMHIYLPTSAEMGQATIVSTFFNLPSGYSLR